MSAKAADRRRYQVRDCLLSEENCTASVDIWSAGLQSYFLFFISDVRVQGPLLQDWGRIAANFLRNQWICLSFLIKAFGIPKSVESPRASETLKAALSCSVEALALLPSDLVLPVLTFMETALPQVSRVQVLCRCVQFGTKTLMLSLWSGGVFAPSCSCRRRPSVWRL